MLRIGYLPGARTGAAHEALQEAACQAIRTECSADCASETPVLDGLLRFLGDGDCLVVANFSGLGPAERLRNLLDTLDMRGAKLEVLEPRFSSHDPARAVLNAALEELIAKPETPARRVARTLDEFAALHATGAGPVEIARRLGVSRMTVWRKLRTLES